MFLLLPVFFTHLTNVGSFLSWAGSKFVSQLSQAMTWRGRPGFRCCSPACEVTQHLAAEFLGNIRVARYEVFPWCRKTASVRGIPASCAWKGTIPELPHGWISYTLQNPRSPGSQDRTSFKDPRSAGSHQKMNVQDTRSTGTRDKMPRAMIHRIW